MCFLVSGVVNFLAKGVIIVPYCYFATCILERSLMYKTSIIPENMREASLRNILILVSNLEIVF